MQPTTPFRALLTLRRWALRLLAVAAVFAGLHAVVAWQWPVDRADDWTDAYRIGAFMRAIAVVAAAVAFLRWLWSAHQNQSALAGPVPRYSLGWAIGGWFVPGLNFVRPYQVMREIWFGSAAAAGRPKKRGPLLLPWWILWNIALVLTIASAWAGTGDLFALSTVASWAFVADVALVLSASLSALIIGRITNWQETAWSNRAAPDLPPSVVGR